MTSALALPPRGRKRLVGHEHHLPGDGVAVDAEAPFGSGYQILHHQGDMIGIETGAVVGAVAGLAAEKLDDAAHAALPHSVFALDH